MPRKTGLSATSKFKGGSFVEGLAVRLRDPHSGTGNAVVAVDVGAEAPTYLEAKGKKRIPFGNDK